MKLKEVSRRSFLQGLAVLGATGVIAGCSKDDDTYLGSGGGGSYDDKEPEDLSDFSQFNKYLATCPHNCGPTTRCVSTIWVKDGKIRRVTSVDSEVGADGVPYNKDINDARKLACAKGRAYKGRVHHNGRLKYPMKQTKERGDLTGFVRISWEQAYDEVLRKYWAITAKYGPRAIKSFGNSSSGSAGNGDSASAVSVVTTNGGALGGYSDHSFHQYNYGNNIVGVPGSASYSSLAFGPQILNVYYGRIKNWVSFGTNSMTTNNTLSYIYLKGNQKANELGGFKHYVISPELTDTGVLCATDWVQIRNQTDPALIAGMIYHMIVNTFNTDGTIMQNPMLDVNYIDTVLYGFFDSPTYWVRTTASGGTRGEILLVDPQDTTNYRKINAVPSGRSYASWIMGSDTRLEKAKYNASNNYTAQKYGDMPRAGKCSLPVKGVPAKDVTNWATATDYYTKKDYMTPKSPEWAEKICGTPAAVIRELAELYANDANKPILTEWTGGLQKSENGVFTLMSIQTLFAVTKNWGYSAGSTGGMYQTWGTALPGNMGSAQSAPTGVTVASVPSIGSIGSDSARSGSSSTNGSPSISCAEHHQGLLFAFKEQLEKNPEWTGYANPQWDGNTRYLYDAAGAKTLYMRKCNSAGSEQERNIQDPDGVTRTYKDWVTQREAGISNSDEPVYTGIRMYIGGAGVMLNGVQNPNWATEIFKCLPLAGHPASAIDDADTFCLAAFDFHLHAHVRFADYVFPMANTLEGPASPSVGGISFPRPGLVTPPGEALTGWDAAYLGWRQRSKTMGASKTFTRIDGADPFTITTAPDLHKKIIGQDTYISQYDKWRLAQQKTIDAAAPTSPMYGKTPEQVVSMMVRYQNQQNVPADPGAVTISNATRINLDTYLAGSMTEPFITFVTGRQFTPSVSNASNAHTSDITSKAPGAHGKMSCFVEYAVYTWENANNIHHGWLPFEERGNKNKDYENDPFILPIPMYYDFRDAFNEMYGVFNTNQARKNLQVGWKLIGQKPATNDISLIKDRLTITFGNTHDRFRSHSSTAENPYTRELNCRVKGGGWASGNDWQEYGVIPEAKDIKEGENAKIPAMRSAAIAKKNMKTASWHEFWLNDEDCAEFGIKDGDLIRVSNPVGAVRAIARATARIVRGHGQLHHGAWYDPNPVDGVDDGGCASTLTSSRPSKLDNGNSLHCAYCVVEKETKF